LIGDARLLKHWTVNRDEKSKLMSIAPEPPNYRHGSLKLTRMTACAVNSKLMSLDSTVRRENCKSRAREIDMLSVSHTGCQTCMQCTVQFGGTIVLSIV